MSYEILEQKIIDIINACTDCRVANVKPEHRLLADLQLDEYDNETVLTKITKNFGIKRPAIADRKAYIRKLQDLRGWHISDLSLCFRQPPLHVPDLTIREIAIIAEKGTWPENFLYPTKNPKKV